MTDQDKQERPSQRPSAPPRRPRDEIKSQLRRLGRASRTVDIVRELQRLALRFGPKPRLGDLPLGSLTALAEGHLRDRREPSRDPLTGLLDAAAFDALWRAHAELRAAGEDGAGAVAVTVTLCGCSQTCEERIPALLRQLAAACVEAVALGDCVGRIAPTTLAVLPVNGGARGAEIVAARLHRLCGAIVNEHPPVRIEVALRALGGARVQVEPRLSGHALSGDPCALCHGSQQFGDAHVSS
ncbi:MAG: hypothetical protein ACHQ53_15720 [Polyangiales bacterium]